MKFLVLLVLIVACASYHNKPIDNESDTYENGNAARVR